jgi:hypothetical protein
MLAGFICISLLAWSFRRVAHTPVLRVGLLSGGFGF